MALRKLGGYWLGNRENPGGYWLENKEELEVQREALRDNKWEPEVQLETLRDQGN